MAPPSELATNDAWPTIRRLLAMSVYVPTLAQVTALSISIPVVPLFIQKLGGTVSDVGLAVGMASLASAACGIPSGYLTAHVGEKKAILIGLATLVVVALLCTMCWDVQLLIAAQVFNGGGQCLVQVSRQAFLAEVVPKELRGRATSLVGAMVSLAAAIGPAIGGIALETGGPPLAFAAQALVYCVAFAVVMCCMPSAPRHEAAKSVGKPIPIPPPANDMDASTAPAPSCLRRCVPLGLMRVAPTATLLVFLRASRNVVLPLIAKDVGLRDWAVGTLASLSYTCTLVLFPVAGFLIDRFGRKASGVPSLAIQGSAFALLGAARSLPETFLSAALLGVGNGITVGLIQTLGQDLAPTEGRAKFLGIFKVWCEAGGIVGPPMVGLVSQVVSLRAASICVGVIGMLGALWYGGCGEETGAGHKAGRRRGGFVGLPDAAGPVDGVPAQEEPGTEADRELVDLTRAPSSSSALVSPAPDLPHGTPSPTQADAALPASVGGST